MPTPTIRWTMKCLLSVAAAFSLVMTAFPVGAQEKLPAEFALS